MLENTEKGKCGRRHETGKGKGKGVPVCAGREGLYKSGVIAVLIITWVFSFKSRPLHHRVNSS